MTADINGELGIPVHLLPVVPTWRWSPARVFADAGLVALIESSPVAVRDRRPRRPGIAPAAPTVKAVIVHRGDRTRPEVGTFRVACRNRCHGCPPTWSSCLTPPTPRRDRVLCSTRVSPPAYGTTSNRVHLTPREREVLGT